VDPDQARIEGHPALAGSGPHGVKRNQRKGRLHSRAVNSYSFPGLPASVTYPGTQPGVQFDLTIADDEVIVNDEIVLSFDFTQSGDYLLLINFLVLIFRVELVLLEDELGQKLKAKQSNIEFAN
jgi:hypothetical protein